MKMRFVSVTVGFVAVLALAACKSSSSSGSGGGIAGSGGTGGGTAGSGGTAGAGGSGPDCTCACTTLMSAGGCGDLCNESLNGTTNPNYCNMSAALSECTTCLMNSCHFTSDEISDTTACQ